MGVDQIDKIDFISTTSEGNVELTISDHLEWDDYNEHLLILQNKLNSYLHFIESGQLFEDYPNSKNKIITINIVMKFQPNKAALLFLSNSQNIINKVNIGFSWKILEEK